jgi:phosphoribosylamine--glycine ligase
MKTLLIGSGGREHALAWKLAQSPLISKLICAPGNAGIAQVCDCVNIGAEAVDALVDYVIREHIEFVVVGPEGPLAGGIVDKLSAIGIPAFGPTAAAAQLESSKAFTKDFCTRHNIPTAGYGVFTDAVDAKAYLETMKPPYVLKADGLAAGKGVVIPETIEDARTELDEFFSGKFGAASAQVVIEEFMTGEEVSFFAISDGKTALPLIGAQDHKRVGEGDTGPNTGGMGAYAPAPIFTKAEQARVMKTIIAPTVAGMAREGNPFTGVLFAGLMMTSEGPKLIEYNARFGDPECQVVMQMLTSDLMEIFIAAAAGRLGALSAPTWDMTPTVNVVMCASGYPARYKKGTMIKGVEAANSGDGVRIFHAGTKRGDDGALLSNGGRVLNVTARAGALKGALDKAYSAIDNDIDWPEGFVRRDIGWRAL